MATVFVLKEPTSKTAYHFVYTNTDIVETRQLEESGFLHRTFETSDIEVFLELLTDKGLHGIIREVMEHL